MVVNLKPHKRDFAVFIGIKIIVLNYQFFHEMMKTGLFLYEIKILTSVFVCNNLLFIKIIPMFKSF